MKIISRVSTNISMNLLICLFNEYIENNEEKPFKILDYLDVLKVDKEYICENKEKLLNDLIIFSFDNDGDRITMFNKVFIDEEYNIMYVINDIFKNIATNIKLDINIEYINNLNNINLKRFYFKIITNDKEYITIDELKEIFDSHYRYSLDRDFIELIVKPAINEINKNTNICITYFRKVCGEDKYNIEYIFS